MPGTPPDFHDAPETAAAYEEIGRCPQNRDQPCMKHKPYTGFYYTSPALSPAFAQPLLLQFPDDPFLRHMYLHRYLIFCLVLGLWAGIAALLQSARAMRQEASLQSSDTGKKRKEWAYSLGIFFLTLPLLMGIYLARKHFDELLFPAFLALLSILPLVHLFKAKRWFWPWLLTNFLFYTGIAAFSFNLPQINTSWEILTFSLALGITAGSQRYALEIARAEDSADSQAAYWSNASTYPLLAVTAPLLVVLLVFLQRLPQTYLLCLLVPALIGPLTPRLRELRMTRQFPADYSARQLALDSSGICLIFTAILLGAGLFTL